MKKNILSIGLMFCTFSSFAQTNPVPFSLSGGNYTFEGFGDDANTEFPASMAGWGGKVIVGTANTAGNPNQQASTDASLYTTSEDFLNATIKNEGVNGISLRGDTTGLGSFGIVVALDTRGVDSIKFGWSGQGIHAGVPSPSELQVRYRIGSTGPWTDLKQYVTVTYGSENVPPKVFAPIVLPDSLENKSLVQFQWVMVLDAPARLTSGRGKVINFSFTSKLVQLQVPEAAFKVNKTTAKVDELLSFTNESVGSADTYLWDFGDGSTDNQINTAHAYTTPGKYTVKLAVTNAAGTDEEVKVEFITIVPKDSAAVNIDYAKYNERNEWYFDGNNLKTNNLQIYKNIKVYNFLGKEILSFDNVINTIPLTNSFKGVYFISYNTDNGKFGTQRIMLF